MNYLGTLGINIICVYIITWGTLGKTLKELAKQLNL
jgi:hypothetical protein